MFKKKECRTCGETKLLSHFYAKQPDCKICYNKKQNKRKRAVSKTHLSNNVLIIPDTHAPYHHKDTIAFLKAVKTAYQPRQVIHLGDEVDHHAMSMHDSDPNLPSAGDELKLTREFIAELGEIFPVMKLCDSNHGSMVYRRAKKHGMPREAIRPYNEFLQAPDTWEWGFEFDIDGVLFCHGDGKRGDGLAAARYNFGSIVMGHHHSEFGVRFQTVQGNRHVFGMNCGCLIDEHSLAFAYGKKGSKRPVLGCGLLVNGHPMLIRMKVDDNNRWTGEL
jgi:predicted phosphodiesterase